MVTEDEHRDAIAFLERLRQNDIPYLELMGLINDAMDLAIEHADKMTRGQANLSAIERYLATGLITPGIVYDGSRLIPTAYTPENKERIVASGRYLISAYPLLKYFTH